MSDFIMELKQDHREIVRLFNLSRKSGLTIDQRLETLVAAKEILLAHLSKEDEKLYPVLLNNTVQNNSFNRTAEEFSKGMKRISSIIIKFFAKHEKKPEGIRTSSDFSKVLRLLQIRIEREEKVLYTAYSEYIRCN